MAKLCALFGSASPRLLERLKSSFQAEADRWNWDVTTYEADEVTILFAQLPTVNDSPSVTIAEDGTVASLLTGYVSEDCVLHTNPSKSDWERQLTRMGGLFNFIYRSQRDNAWWIAADRNSYAPLFFRHLEGSLVVASEVKFLLAGSPPELNSSALGSLLHSGYLLNNDTLFNGIDRLPSGTYLARRNGHTTTEHYWSINDHTVRAAIHDNDLIHEGSRLVTDCIQSSLSQSTDAELLLSGGWDSRWIAAVASTMNLPNVRSTCAVKPNSWKDANIAPKVARRLGLHHRTLQFSWDLIYSGLVDKVWCVDGLCEEHLWSMQLLPQLPSASIVYDGFCGDPLMSGTYESGPLMHLFDSTISWQDRFKNYTGSVDDLNLFVDHREDMTSAYRDHLYACTLRYRDSPFPSLAFGLENRMKNAMSLMEKAIWERRSVLRYPFVDVQLQDYMLSLPPAIRAGGHFNRAMLNHAFPKLRNIPSTHDSRSSSATVISKIKHRFQRFGRASGLFPASNQSALNAQKRALHKEKHRLIHLLEVPAPFSRERILSNLGSGGRQQYGGWDRSLSVLQILIWYNLFVLGRSRDELLPPTAKMPILV